MPRVNLKRAAVRRALEAAFETTVRDYGQQMGLTFKLAVFDYPRTTRRKNGDTVGSPRDVYDLGGLSDSQSVQKVSSTAFKFEWKAPYAAVTFLGGTTKTGLVIPARNVPHKTLELWDFSQAFAQNFSR